MTDLSPVDALLLRLNILCDARPNESTVDCVTRVVAERDRATRDRDTMAETLTIAQARGTALHNELVDLKRQVAEYRDYQQRAENIDTLQGEVAKALQLTPEQAVVARSALAKANAALLYWRELAELGMAVHKDSQQREIVMLAALRFYASLSEDVTEADPGGTARAALTTLGEKA